MHTAPNSANHSRTSSLAEETPDGYTPMMPGQTDDGYVDMEPSSVDGHDGKLEFIFSSQFVPIYCVEFV